MNDKIETWEDPIVAEVRSVRDSHARQFNYDLKAIVADLIRKQSKREAEGKKFVTFSPPAERKTDNRSELPQSSEKSTI